MLVLSAFLMAMLIAVSALTISIAHIQLTRTELRTAADAAAKAGVTILGQTQSISQARAATRDMAARHRVAGDALLLDDSDIEFGSSRKLSDGTYQFTVGATPTNSIRVAGRRTDGSPSGSVPVLFKAYLNTDKFETSLTATATRADHDICLVIDRSGSMAWDLSNKTFSYPAELNGKSTIQNYFLPPHATASRWASLASAVNVFIDIVNQQSYDAHVGLVSYSSAFKFGNYQSTVSTIDQSLTATHSALLTSLTTIGKSPIIGDTNIGAGMTQGIQVLTDPARSRITAGRTMIVMTDGLMTEGSNPVDIATAARAQNITVHAITFGAGADQTLMKKVARAGEGDFYHAPNTAQLQAAFRAIALSLPSILTQ